MENQKKQTSNSNDCGALKNFISELREKKGDRSAAFFLAAVAVSFANAFMRALNDAVERGEFDALLRSPNV